MNSSRTILVVEDEAPLGKAFKISLSRAGYDTQWVGTGEDAVAWMDDHRPDLVLLDLRLPGMDGMEVLENAGHRHPETSVIIMSAHGDVQTVVQAMKLGAANFLPKPVDLNEMVRVIEKQLATQPAWSEIRKESTNGSPAIDKALSRIMGSCPGIRRAKALITRLCSLPPQAFERPPNVLITGETGTGKDLVARALHDASPRRDEPFIHVNCAGLPETLVESELFGHKKGAFTDAKAEKEGLFTAADGGTLFLDEVSALPMSQQAKILTAIEHGCIRPVGGLEERAIRVQLVTAMNEDPESWVRQGRLREDLLHRLRVVHVHLPALRERGGDIDLLAEHFVTLHAERFALPKKNLSPEARQALHRYSWPGNVRELCHRLESAVLLSGTVIGPELLPSEAESIKSGPGRGNALDVDFSRGPVPLEHVEREMINRALLAADYNVTRAAELLDVTRDALRYRIEKYGLAIRKNGA